MNNAFVVDDQRENSFYIKFYPGIKASIGCGKATLILGRFEYWFTKYKKGFYKFIEPCNHPLYRTGDSWAEEVGFSRKVFTKAFDVIGVRYKSKSAFQKSKDKFQGKLYASYHDRKTNQTYFFRNHEFTSQLLERLFKKRTSAHSPKPAYKKNEEKTLENNSLEKISPKKSSLEKTQPISAPSDLSQGRSRSGDLGRSYARASSFIHKKTSSLEGEISNSTHTPYHHFKEETEEMIKIWKEEIGELGVHSLSNGLFQRLQNVFKEVFNQSIESWKTYCQMISSSKFLMGEAQNKFFKKAWITWAIKAENIERVKGGDFKLGDRQTNYDKEIETIDKEIRSVEYKKHQLEMKISNIKSDERDKRRNIVKERIKNISKEERQSLKQDFEAQLEKENNSMTEEFRKSRWNGMFISVYFDSFIEEKIYAELFKNVDETHDEKVIQSSGLLELLNDVCNEIAQVRETKKKLLKA